MDFRGDLAVKWRFLSSSYTKILQVFAECSSKLPVTIPFEKIVSEKLRVDVEKIPTERIRGKNMHIKVDTFNKISDNLRLSKYLCGEGVLLKSVRLM